MKHPIASLPGLSTLLLSTIFVPACGREEADSIETLGAPLAAWAEGNVSQVLRVNTGETTVRNICELTVPLASPKPLTFSASITAGANPVATLGWSGNAVADPIAADGFSVTGCGTYPCDVVARWRTTSTNGSVLGCEVAADDGTSRLVGQSSGTALTVAAPPSSPVIFNQDVKIGSSGSSIAASCVLRQNDVLPAATVTAFKVFLNGAAAVDVPGPISLNSVYPTKGPDVPFGNLYLGWEQGATRLKHVTARKEQLVEGDALRCAGLWSDFGSAVYDVNVSNAPTGNGMSLTREGSGWTCNPASFGTGDGCDCSCGIVDPDCSTYFSEDFSNNLRGWLLEGEWQIGPTQPSAGQQQGFPDPATDHSSGADNGVAGIVVGGNYTNASHNAYYLTSPAISLTGGDAVFLTFWRYLNADWDPYTTQTVEVFNGTSWVVIWTNASLGQVLLTDSAWTLMQFDVTAYANAAFRVRFGHKTGSSGGFLPYIMSGWNIDDLSLSKGVCP